MRILFYSTKDFEKSYLEAANTGVHEVSFIAEALNPSTAHEADGFDAVSIFTGDDASGVVLDELSGYGVRFIAIRAAGYDNVDLDMASQLGIMVANVPEYSPYAIAEHAVALILGLCRKLVIANRQVHQENFTLDRLVGFDLHGKTVGIIGTGRIGVVLAKILNGFGCRLLGFDLEENIQLVKDYDLRYTSLATLCHESDIISLHTPLTPQTKYLIDENLIRGMKPGVMLINTGRGGCVNTRDVLKFILSGHIGSFGSDVYENERGIFFFDLRGKNVYDEMLQDLLAMPNVLLTPHQAFATREALQEISATTFGNIDAWKNNLQSRNELTKVLVDRLS